MRCTTTETADETWADSGWDGESIRATSGRRQVLVVAAPRKGARCHDLSWAYTGLFFSERPMDIAEAKTICDGCAVRQPCLDGALARREPVGVWGGECFFNGRIVPTRRGRGRPRKNAIDALG